jgi:hypothetical protein
MNNTVTTFTEETDTAVIIQRQNCGKFFIPNSKKTGRRSKYAVAATQTSAPSHD